MARRLRRVAWALFALSCAVIAADWVRYHSGWFPSEPLLPFVSRRHPNAWIHLVAIALDMAAILGWLFADSAPRDMRSSILRGSLLGAALAAIASIGMTLTGGTDRAAILWVVTAFLLIVALVASVFRSAARAAAK